MENQGVERRKCPLCGGEITVSEIFQYSHNRKLTKSGRISQRFTKQVHGSIELFVAGCECGAYWEEEDFAITKDGRFLDYKYTS